MSAADALYFFGLPGRKPPTSSSTANPIPVDAAHRSIVHLLIRSSFNCLQTECSSATRTEGYDGFFARDGCTHFGSPGIFEKLGGELRLADAHRLHALD